MTRIVQRWWTWSGLKQEKFWNVHIYCKQVSESDQHKRSSEAMKELFSCQEMWSLKFMDSFFEKIPCMKTSTYTTVYWGNVHVVEKTCH